MTVVDPVQINTLLAASAARHSHLCPRQVLGVRVGLAGRATLGLPPNSGDKRLLVISEMDGCFLDGVEVATGATPGHRTLRIEDYGKAAAVFIDTQTGRSVRVAPRLDARKNARQYTQTLTGPGGEIEDRSWYIQLEAYQVMPDHALLSVLPVQLSTPIEEIISRPGVRASCAACGEEIINEREVKRDGESLCRSCAGLGYYHFFPEGE